MGITKKLTLMSLAGVLILGVLATIFSVQSLNKQGQAEIDAIERTLISEKKGKLQDLVRNTFAILEHKYHAAHDPKLVAAVYRRQLKSIVEVAYSAVERIYQEDGQSDEAKRQAAMDVIKAMRYQDQDYLWINDTHPTMVMHPFKPALDGKDLSGFKDPNGKFLFKEFAKTCRESGEGFVDYLWPRPGHDKPVPKLSYVKLFKPWGWIIGTGVYLETAEERFQKEARDIIGSLRFGAESKDYFWINDTHPTMVMHPVKPALDGKDLSGFKDPNGKFLFKEFVEVCRKKGEGFVDYMWPKPGLDKPVRKLSYVKLFDKWGWIVGTGIYLDDVDQIVAAKRVEVQKQLSGQRNRIIGVMVVVLLVAGTGVFLVAHKISSSIVSAGAMLKDIAEGEGDLTRTMTVQAKGEVAEMVRSFNLFVEKIRVVIAEVKNKALRLNDSSRDLAGISEHLSQGTEQTSVKAGKVSEAAGTMSGNVSAVAAAMEQASINMGMVTTAVEEMTATINEIAENTGKASTITSEAVQQTDHASVQVSELGSAAQQIGNVVETITEISEQVNLLALNATIEAARAGDAGKGFAVVANEIKELARQTADATGEIKKKVEDIQSSTRGTVVQIGTITDVVKQVNEIVSTIATAVEEQSVTTREIAGNVSQASQGIGEVSQRVAQNSEFSSSIATEISEVTQAAGQMANSSNQVNLRAGELAELSRGLNEMVGRFKV